MQPDLNNLPLRDIHLPSSVSWWPPAPGWWLLLGISIAIFITILILKRKRRRLRIRTIALTELKHLRTQYQTTRDAQQLIQSLSILLRRVGLSYYPRANIASQTGTDWLRSLDRLTSTRALPADVFSQGIGRIFATAPYQNNPDSDTQTILQLCELWLQHLPPLPHPDKPLNSKQTKQP